MELACLLVLQLLFLFALFCFVLFCFVHASVLTTPRSHHVDTVPFLGGGGGGLFRRLHAKAHPW